MIRLARYCTLRHDIVPYSAVNGPKLDPSLCLRYRLNSSVPWLPCVEWKAFLHNSGFPNLKVSVCPSDPAGKIRVPLRKAAKPTCSLAM